MDYVNKPLIIINCSKEKADHTCRPIDLYSGNNSLATIIRSKSNIIESYSSTLYPGHRGNYTAPQFKEVADVWVLSAEYGLIDGYGDSIAPYDNELPADPSLIADFVTKHTLQANKALRNLNISERTVYVCMSEKYRNALFSLVGAQLEETANLYVADGFSGIGDLRGRLTKVCNKVALDYVISSTKHNVPVTYPIVFRSGNTSKNEMNIYHVNHEHIGTSLHYINSNKPPQHMEKLIDVLHSTTRNSHVFLDNGYISNPNLKVDWVLDEYLQLANRVRSDSRHKLSIVLPDHTEPFRALELIRNHKSKILSLVETQVRIILPVHDWGTSSSIKKHIKEILKELGWPNNLVAGIPCLKQRAYELGKIESILSAKTPSGEQVFSGVHFLGLGDAKRRVKEFCRRLMIARIFNIRDISFDSNRTNALFGNKNENIRQCTKLETILESELTKCPLHRSVFSGNLTITYDRELVKDFFELELSEKNVDLAVSALNKHLPNSFQVSRMNNEEDRAYLTRCKRFVLSLNNYIWEILASKVVTELVDLQIIQYDASHLFSYYEKRSLAYREYKKQLKVA